MFEEIGALIALLFSLGLATAIAQPFNNAIVRLRANYLPKAISLDSVLEDGTSAPRAVSAYFLREGRQAAKIGPVVDGVWDMLQRIRRLEGIGGLYKGTVPASIQLVFVSVLTGILFGVSGGGGYKAAPTAPGQFGFFTNIFFMALVAVFALPLNVITHRAMVHPRLLPINRARENLRELLSPSEIAQPWRLYAVPGLLGVTLAHVAWIGLATRLVRHVTVPSLGGLPPQVPAGPNDKEYSAPGGDQLGVSTFGLAVFVLWNIASVLVLSPLEVLAVRLAVQRPEQQQPLHLAYARVPSGGAGGPSPYSHQATTQQPRPEGAYADDGAPNSDEVAGVPRPSFAIEEEDDDEEEEGATQQNGDSKAGAKKPKDGAPEDPIEAPKPHSSVPADHPRADDVPSRVLGSQQQQQQGAPQNGAANFPSSNLAPSKEPVIALRPCDVPLTPSAAAQAEAEGFGAPVVERYTGLVDCMRKLIDEEGVEALYRGAWVTLIGVFVGSFVL